MPFDRSAKIELIYRRTNFTDMPPELSFMVHFLVSTQLRDPATEVKFYAYWNRENPVAPGKPFTMLDVKGKGILPALTCRHRDWAKVSPVFSKAMIPP